MRWDGGSGCRCIVPARQLAIGSVWGVLCKAFSDN